MKSIVTIEKEYFDNEEGVPCVKRIVKEDGVLIQEDSTEISKIERIDSKLNIFERWIDEVKNPDKFVGKRGTYVFKRGKLERVSDSKRSKNSGN